MKFKDALAIKSTVPQETYKLTFYPWQDSYIWWVLDLKQVEQGHIPEKMLMLYFLGVLDL